VSRPPKDGGGKGAGASTSAPLRTLHTHILLGGKKRERRGRKILRVGGSAEKEKLAAIDRIKARKKESKTQLTSVEREGGKKKGGKPMCTSWVPKTGVAEKERKKRKKPASTFSSARGEKKRYRKFSGVHISQEEGGNGGGGGEKKARRGG